MLTDDVNTNGYSYLEALTLADQGLPVIPTVNKTPAVGGSFYAATVDLEKIKAWGKAFPSAGIATPTGINNPYKLVVIDAENTEMLDMLRDKLGREPDVYTQRGGHWYYRHHQRGKIKSGPIGDGVDRKADGGIVEIPPTPAKRWADGMPDLSDLPEIPEDLAKMPLYRPESTRTAGGRPGAGGAIPDGVRNETLASLAGTMRRPGMEPGEIDAALQEINCNRCQPPLPPEEVIRIAASVGSYEPMSQHHNVPSKTPVMFNHRKNPVAISFSTGGRPEPRCWVVDNILPERFPTTLYGDSGKAKSFVASHIGQSVADPKSAEWMGYPVQSGPVLYLDFEMDEIEQRRRAYDVAAGRGETAPPEEFFYMECVEYTPEAVFNAAYDLCLERGVKLVIIDSMGMAIEGDSETSSDTNAFYRNCINPLRSLGVAVLVIDHQAKKQKGENYVDKDIFGSTYKKANNRNVFQIHGEWKSTNELHTTLRHTKSNLGPQLDPIHIGITFEGGCVTIGGREADTAGASQSDLIVLHLSNYGPSTAAAIAEALGMGEGTVRNRLGEMNGKRVEKAGKVDRAQSWLALDEHHNEDTRDVVTLGSSPELTEDPSADAA